MSSSVSQKSYAELEAIPVKVQAPEKPFKGDNKIYVRSVNGHHETVRRVIGGVLIAIFLLIPWLDYGGQQAVLLDFTAQRFSIFGVTYWPQDFLLLAWVFMAAAFALFLVTALFGRVWCGYACPQTVFTFIFIWLEEKTEGSRHQRMKLDKQPLNRDKVLKKTAKHLSWALVSLLTSLAFVSYFVPARALYQDIVNFDASFWSTFYVLFFAVCTYLNAGWMRQIMCTHICPYSRFQSSMFDQHTLTTTYNAKRGEHRGPRSRSIPHSDLRKQDKGDCIDCNLCVQVCPAGIDIRDGLQYECINCGACIDACNNVMTKMNYPKGLISMLSAQQLKRLDLNARLSAFFRGKTIGYMVVYVVILAAMAVSFTQRSLVELDVLRDRSSLYRETFSGDVENTYTLVVMNRSQQEQVYHISASGLPGLTLIGTTKITVGPGALETAVITLSAEKSTSNAGKSDIDIVVSSLSDGKEDHQARSPSTFLFPKV